MVTTRKQIQSEFYCAKIYVGDLFSLSLVLLILIY